MKLLCALALLAAPATASAQVQRPSLGAESGVYTEAYGITGRAARRPDQTMQIYASPSFSWMGFEIGTTLLWTTDNQFTAQTTNRLYLNPRWRWGQLHLGDFTPNVSRYTASAVRLRGGGMELTPGKLRFGVAGGRAQDATNQSLFDAAPRRSLVAALAGYGRTDGTFIEISALRALDDSAGSDTIPVSPQENLVAAVAGALGLGTVRLRGEYAASLYSRDIRASELDSLSQPAGGAFTPRLSSRFDRAFGGEARLTLGKGSFAAQYEEVGPGFTSLGNPFLPGDRREARLTAAWRFMRGRLNLAGSAGVRRDNLADDKRGTTYRRTGSLATTYVGGRVSVTSLSVLWNGLSMAPAPLPPGTPTTTPPDTFRLHNVMLSLVLLQQLRFGANVVSLSVSNQDITDDSQGLGGTLDAATTSINLDWSVTVAQQLTLSARPGWQRFKTSAGTEDFASAGLGLTRRAARSPWSVLAAATYTQVQSGSQMRYDAGFGYRLTTRDQVNATVRHTNVSGVAQPFTETLASMRLTHRW